MTKGVLLPTDLNRQTQNLQQHFKSCPTTDVQQRETVKEQTLRALGKRFAAWSRDNAPLSMPGINLSCKSQQQHVPKNTSEANKL